MIDVSKVPISPIVRAGDLLFLSGQVAFDASGRISAPDIAGQTSATLKNIEAVLLQSGSRLTDIVSATVWLTDPADFAAFNAAYAAFFPQTPPARSTVVSALMLPDAKIEIAVVAYAPEKGGH